MSENLVGSTELYHNIVQQFRRNCRNMLAVRMDALVSVDHLLSFLDCATPVRGKDQYVLLTESLPAFESLVLNSNKADLYYRMPDEKRKLGVAGTFKGIPVIYHMDYSYGVDVSMLGYMPIPHERRWW